MTMVIDNLCEFNALIGQSVCQIADRLAQQIVERHAAGQLHRAFQRQDRGIAEVACAALRAHRRFEVGDLEHRGVGARDVRERGAHLPVDRRTGVVPARLSYEYSTTTYPKRAFREAARDARRWFRIMRREVR
ncbi:hypothetical protein AB5I41_26360 [Sphingomonas sp. MMS24-JH45]